MSRESSVIGRLLDNAAGGNTKPLDIELKDFYITSFNQTRDVTPLHDHRTSWGSAIDLVPVPKPKSVSGSLVICDGFTVTNLSFVASDVDSLKKKIEDFRLT